MKKLIVSTRNPSKAEQIKALLGSLPMQVLTLAETEVIGEAVEDGATLKDNAFKKAHFAHEHTGEWAVADDSGIFIDALDGRPGVHSARWAGRDVSTEEIMHYTLEKLRHVLPDQRTATFKTVAVVLSPEGKEYAFAGEVPGRLLVAPRGKCQPKMPYSALFVPDGQNKVWAEMSVEEENAVSHRGKAFAKVREFLQEVV